MRQGDGLIPFHIFDKIQKKLESDKDTKKAKKTAGCQDSGHFTESDIQIMREAREPSLCF
jgi:hypothetical protein